VSYLDRPPNVAIEPDRCALEQIPSALGLVDPSFERPANSFLADKGKPIVPFLDLIVPGGKEILVPPAKKQIYGLFCDS
jgi:hypothetical protein